MSNVQSTLLRIFLIQHSLALYLKFQGLFQNFPVLPNFTPDFETLLAAEIIGQREGFIMALNNITFVIMWFAIIPVVLLPFCKSSYKKIDET